MVSDSTTTSKNGSIHAVKQILIITNQSGFLWKFELENVRILQSMGYRVHYASNRSEDGAYYDQRELDRIGVVYHEIDIARSPYMLKMNYRAFQQLKDIIEKERIDFIHCHTPVGGVLGRLVAVSSKRKLKVIYTAHGFHFYKGAPLVNNLIYKAVEKLLAPLTDVLVVVNKEDFDSAQKLKLRKNGKVYQIPGVGIDLQTFVPIEKQEKAKQKQALGIEKTALFILSVGELCKNKNHVTVIRAIRKMKENHSFDRKIIYGICGDGFFLEETKQLVADLGLSKEVIFFGYQMDIREYYAAADVTIFPSIREGFGMAAVESLAMGVPVIAADNRGTREYMIDGKNGVVCKAMSLEGYIRGIETFLNMDEQKYDEISKFSVASVQKFSNRYSNAVMSEIYKYIDRGIEDDGNTGDQCHNGNV